MCLIWQEGYFSRNKWSGTNDVFSLIFIVLDCNSVLHRVLLYGFLIFPYNEHFFDFSTDRKDDWGLRFWLEKPAIDWMQHIDTRERIIIWVAFDFPDLPYPDFGLLNILRNGRTGFRCSGAPPFRAGRPGASSRLSDRSLGPQLCAARRSLPAGEILPLTHTNGSPLRLVKRIVCVCVFSFSFHLQIFFPFASCAAWIQDCVGHIWSRTKTDYFCAQRE